MKKGILFLLAMFTMITFAEANNSKHPTEVFGFENRYNEAVTFIERGIRFHVFLNGDFDFDSRYFRTRGNRRIRISRDFQGRINRVGNAWVRYDSRGNVRRIGNVTMSYRRGLLRRVGDLRVTYNSWGSPRFYGQVRYNDYYEDYYDNSLSVGFNINLGTVCVYNDPFFYGNEFRRNYRRVREDANYIYYRAGNDANVSRDRILKRRKSKRNGTVTQQTTRPQNNRRTVKRESVDRRRTQTNTNRNKKKRVVNSTNQRRTVQKESTNIRKQRTNSATKKKRAITTESRSTSKKRAKTQSKKRRRS